MPTIEKTFDSVEDTRQWLKGISTQKRPHNIHVIIDDDLVPQDPADEFFENIDKYAVDTGIPDLAENHDHYLYGLHKRNK